jgi:hypothetical protein
MNGQVGNWLDWSAAVGLELGRRGNVEVRLESLPRLNATGVSRIGKGQKIFFHQERRRGILEAYDFDAPTRFGTSLVIREVIYSHSKTTLSDAH